MVEERLHRRVQLLARRQYDLAVVRDPRLALEPLEPAQALVDEPRRLRHLFHTHAIAVVHVAVRVARYAEVDLPGRDIRVVAAAIPGDARRAHVWATSAERVSV